MAREGEMIFFRLKLLKDFLCRLIEISSPTFSVLFLRP